MTLWWSAALVAAGATVGVWLAGSALGVWREERAGRVYELTPRYRGAAVRAVLAAVALCAALAGGVAQALVGLPDSTAPVAAVGSASAARADSHPASDRAPRTPQASGASVASGVAGSAGAAGAPGASKAPGAAGAVTTALTQVGQPSGGRLLQGTLGGVPGQVRIWLPAQYQAHGSGGPVLQAVVVRAPEGELGEVWQGLAGAVAGGHANAFVAVAPADPCALASDDSALRRAVAAQYRIAAKPRSWAELGVDAGSSCAVTAELAHPDVYAGAAVLGGGSFARPSGALPSGIRLLLAQAHRDTAGQGDASRFRTALQGAPDLSVRLSDTVRDLTPELERFRLARLAANYLTEMFTTRH
ncbi:hypothetical protein [Streptacidiphilus fuscans]|uniref:Uncharacterized protein n=1 Tax=Streptacidiphilus fuscans TaxID=2789292 RepID=A0A931FHF5_9ACTN|nr:hypothetical protein [Streptacidiphilus fuscans]MBF9070609.1 hypothetical protein [Streptacidiphilus fuscans]